MGAVQLVVIVGGWIVEYGVPVREPLHGTTLDVNWVPGVAEYQQGHQ